MSFIQKVKNKRRTWNNPTVPFTLIEIAVSFAMFAILVLVGLSFIKSSQKILGTSASNAMAFENAKTALELITRDLHSVYYGTGNTIPFWHKPSYGSTSYKNELIAFVGMIGVPSQPDSVTGLCEIKYQLWYGDEPDSAGWLMRSVTDSTDTTSGKTNYSANITVGLTGTTNAYTANNDSSYLYNRIIPYVTSLSFIGYDINGDTVDSSISHATSLPYSLNVNLTLMDRDAWNKWLSLGGLPSNAGTVSEPKAAREYRLNSQKTFIKTILIGNRGQVD